MRISSVLSSADLPVAELHAGVLDGELMRVGEAYCAIDTVVGPSQRAASIATVVAPWAIAERFTAAWIHGVIHDQPRRLQLCVDSQDNVRPLSSQRFAFREVVLNHNETMPVGGLRVTSPLRTALDIARTHEEFTAATNKVVQSLAALGSGFTLADCIAEMDSRRNLPFKKMAITRLAAALHEESPDYPAVTRYTS